LTHADVKVTAIIERGGLAKYRCFHKLQTDVGLCYAIDIGGKKLAKTTIEWGAIERFRLLKVL
jgi:hypothetical protein